MQKPIPHPVLKGVKALVVGIANDSSIAYGCAKAFQELGADLAVTYLNEKARPHVETLAHKLGASIVLPLDVSEAGQLETVFETIERQWGRLDILVHSIAWAPKDDLQGGLLDCSAEGFAKAMDVSCHSFIRMARLAATLMTAGRHDDRYELPRRQPRGAQLQPDGPCEGGARSLVPIPGVRTGLEGDPRACDVARTAEDPRRLRAQGLRSASDRSRAEGAAGRTRRHHGVGFACAYLATPYARRISGDTIYVDGGVHIMA